MNKNLETWTDINRYLEQEALADCLKGRVRWICKTCGDVQSATAYEIYIDGEPAQRFSMDAVVAAVCGETPPHGCRDMHRFWKVYWQQKDLPVSQRTAFDDEDFNLALWEYNCLGAEEALVSDDPVVRMFAVLDGSIGKRALEGLDGEIDNQPEWLRKYYLLRLEAEEIKIPR